MPSALAASAALSAAETSSAWQASVLAVVLQCELYFCKLAAS